LRTDTNCTSSGSQILFYFDNRTKGCPVHRLYTGWHPLHTTSVFHYTNQMTALSDSQNSKHENRMGSSGCPTRNLKNSPKRKILSPRHSLPLINTSQWSESLFNRSITLKTFKNDTLKDRFERKTVLYNTGPYDCWRGKKPF